jgi:hypothetical protein
MAPHSECPQTTTSRIGRALSANSIAAGTECPARAPADANGGTRFPTLRTTNRSPGSADANTFGATRLSEHAISSASGRWPSASAANVAA